MIATAIKTIKGQTSMEQNVDAANENKVPEYDIEESNDQVNNVQEDGQDPQNFKKIHSASGPVLVMPGIPDLPPSTTSMRSFPTTQHIWILLSRLSRNRHWP